MNPILLSLINIALFDDWNAEIEKKLSRYNESVEKYSSAILKGETLNMYETLKNYYSVICDREQRRTDFLMNKALYAGVKIGYELYREFDNLEDETE